MIRAIRRFLWTIGLLGFGVLLALGYLGFIPGLSNLFGSNTPRDLGAVTTPADLASAQVKLGQELLTGQDVVPSLQTIRSGGVSTVNVRLSGREFAAHLEALHPIKDVQVVFHADGTFEASGRIDKSRLLRYAKMLGYTRLDDSSALHTINTYLPGSPAFYLKGSGTIKDGVPAMELTEANIGRIPASTTGLSKGLLEYANMNLEKVPGLDISTMNISTDGVSIIGTVPAAVPQL